MSSTPTEQELWSIHFKRGILPTQLIPPYLAQRNPQIHHPGFAKYQKKVVVGIETKEQATC